MSPLSRIITVAALTLGIALQAQAIGLRTTFGRVYVKNVPLGTQVSLRQLTGIAYRLTNTSATREKVRIDVLVPRPGRDHIMDGYEPIPDASWVKLGKKEFTLAPGQEGVTEVLINIPKEEAHLEKKYQVFFYARNVAQKRMFAVGLKSQLLIQTRPNLSTPEELKQAQEIIEDLNFYLTPATIPLENFPRGRPVKIRGEMKKSFKIVNVSEKEMVIELGMGSFKHDGIKPNPGFEKPAQGIRLSFEKQKLRLEPDSIGVVRAIVEVPKDPELAGRKFHIPVKARLTNYPVPVSAFGHIYIETEK